MGAVGKMHRLVQLLSPAGGTDPFSGFVGGLGKKEVAVGKVIHTFSLGATSEGLVNTTATSVVQVQVSRVQLDSG